MKVTIQFRKPGFVSAIVLYFTCSDGKFKYSTGESSDQLTSKVKLMIKFIEQTAADFRLASKDLTKDELRRLMDLKFKGIQSNGMIIKMREALAKMKAGLIKTKTKKNYSPGTTKMVKVAIDLLEEFGSDYDQFIVQCHKRDFSINYIGSIIRKLKIVGGHSGYPLDHFKSMGEEVHDIALTEKEIQAIYKLELTGTMDLVRDWFIIDCFTGLRISDLKLLTDKNLDKRFIIIANEKTDEKVIIPVNKFVNAILKKYSGFPPRISDQEINREIKKIAQKAKITSKHLYPMTKGGKRVDYYGEKWEFVSNHTARRTFITNLLKAKVPTELVMKLTGIKSYATIKKYNKMTSEDAALIMSKHEFFK